MECNGQKSFVMDGLREKKICQQSSQGYFAKLKMLSWHDNTCCKPPYLLCSFMSYYEAVLLFLKRASVVSVSSRVPLCDCQMGNYTEAGAGCARVTLLPDSGL